MTRTLYIPSSVSVPAQSPTVPVPIPGSEFNDNMILILALLLCALICALGLNSIVRCALRCSGRFTSGPAVRLASSGLRRRALRALPVTVYSDCLKLIGTGSECAICLSDLIPGEKVRVLPMCRHGFHVQCIDKWLMARASCPTCRHGLLSAEPKKGLGCVVVDRVDPAQSVLVPLEHEGVIHNYRVNAS